MNLTSKPPGSPSKKPLLPHRTSIATVCVSGHLLDKLTAISEAGFDGVEIFENDLLHYPGSRQDVYNVCQELGLKIEMYQPFRDLEGAPNEEELKRSLDRLERKFQWMDELHTDLILLCSNCSPNSVSLFLEADGRRSSVPAWARADIHRLVTEQKLWRTYAQQQS